MTSPARLTGSPRSIQGERQAALDTAIYADDSTVAAWVEEHEANVVTCREKGRHDYPGLREVGVLTFDSVDLETGLHIRRVRCRKCKLVGTIEEWDVRHKGDTVVSAERVSSRPDYSYVGPNGEKYLSPPGYGRMLPKQVRNAVGTQLLKGKSFRQLRKEAMAASRRPETEG